MILIRLGFYTDEEQFVCNEFKWIGLCRFYYYIKYHTNRDVWEMKQLQKVKRICFGSAPSYFYSAFARMWNYNGKVAIYLLLNFSSLFVHFFLDNQADILMCKREERKGRRASAFNERIQSRTTNTWKCILVV